MFYTFRNIQKDKNSFVASKIKRLINYLSDNPCIISYSQQLTMRKYLSTIKQEKERANGHIKRDGNVQIQIVKNGFQVLIFLSLM